jgi:hypothetical protein
MPSNYESGIFGGIVRFLGQFLVRVQCLGPNELVENFKLVPRPVDKGPRPKSGKLRLNRHGTYFGGKNNWFEPKKTVLNGELLIWRTMNQARDPCIVNSRI